MSYPYQQDPELQPTGYYPPPVASPPYAPAQPQHLASPPPGPIQRRNQQPLRAPPPTQDAFYPPARTQTTSPFADPAPYAPQQAFDQQQGARGAYYDDAQNQAQHYPPHGASQHVQDPFEDNTPLLRTNYLPPSLPSQQQYFYDQQNPYPYDPNTPYDPNQTPYDPNQNSYNPPQASGGGYDQGLGGGYGMGGVPGGYVGDDDAQSMVRYGRIPQRQPRRYKTVKRVNLYHGNLVLDCQVPPKLLESCPRKDDREFTHMRYTAATCDPNDFFEERYSLRQVLYDPPRRTELFITLTMYNEDEVLFCRTMHGVMKNVQHLCSRTRSKTWGAEGWKKVVICIVSDGRAKVNSRTLSVLAALGVYQDGVAKNVVAGKPVTAHIYEYTTQISIDPDLKFKTAERGLMPVQLIFCLKEKNAKKINSHRWFFNAFGPVLQPNVCVLLDVGTQPGPTSIYKLWKTFDLNSNVGGACGEIVALKGKYFRNLLNPLVAAQNFEYKMSNILDKPLESVFGYITVLPGAFSAYRYIALQNDSRGEGPLREYFKGESLHHQADADLWTKNMYLAEDRILCWELVSKRNSAWLLHYQRSAYAVTDVPDTVPDLISQRRRWLNGSFFAGLHSTVHFGYLYRSDHTLLRKAWLHVELVYQTFNIIFAWFALGNYFITFTILTQSLSDPSFGLQNIAVFNTILRYYYVALLISCFLLAMGNRPQGSAKMFTWMMISFAIITVYMLFAAGFITAKGIINIKNAVEASGGQFTTADVFSNSIFRNIVLSLLATYGLYLLSSIIFFDPAHMFTSFFQYLLLAPSYINVINVYAFCNVQDVTWGNRPEEKPQQDLGVVKGAEGKEGAVDVVVPTDEKDINAAYEDACHVLASKAPPQVEKVDLEVKMTDSYRAIRTNVVLAWSLTNGALVAGILSTSAGGNITTDGGSAKVNIYMTFLLFSVAGLALFRFIGCFVYTIFWMFQH